MRKPLPRKRRPPGKSVPVARDDKKLRKIAGLPAVAAVFRMAPDSVEKLYFLDGLKTACSDYCLTLARAHKLYRVVRPDELERLAGSAMHGGILALAKPREVPSLDIGDARGWARAGEAILILDGVGNPHNLGAIARTAAFFGVPRLVLSDHPAQALPSDASYRVSEGGLELIGVYRARRLPDVLTRIRPGYRVIGTSLERGQPLDSRAASPKPVALVLGNEEAGLTRETLDACDEIVTIPGAGLVQSLNVAATAAILIHDLLRRRG
jgi:TrmH RNA methyltransferase